MYDLGGKVEDGESSLQAALRELEVWKALRKFAHRSHSFPRRKLESKLPCSMQAVYSF
jgi:hypothetical protein